MPRLGILAVALALGACGATGATGEPAGEPPPDDGPPPGGEPRPPDDEDADGFDPSDPRSYRWTAKVPAFRTLPILFGSVAVEYEWIDAGGETVRRALEPGAVLAEDMTFDRLTDGTIRLITVRAEDRMPMTGCQVLVGGGNAVASHDAILAAGYPDVAPTGDFTDPADYREYVRAQPGIVMAVDGDCTTVHPDNPTEDRSVLSWLAITAEAEPDPELFDPGDPPDTSGGIGSE